jgi:acyl-CoA thioesterase-1
MKITQNDRIVFFGDSITDAGRIRENDSDLGKGYVFLTAASLHSKLTNPEFKIWNKGISGNRIYDLESRLDNDVFSLKPTVVSILIGINDVWHFFSGGKPSPHNEFYNAYHRILMRITKELKARVIILEPFLLPIPEDRKTWRADLDVKIQLIRDLAREFSTEYIPLDGIFARASAKVPMAHWMQDGVHPSLAGHSVISEHWLKNLEN